jgi:hypothetical protein
MTTGLKSSVPAALDPDRALSDVLDSLLTGDRDREGQCFLAYAPDAKLRSLLQIRLYKLQAALAPARPADLARVVTEMLLGFSSARVSEEDAEAVVTQYVTVLSGLPLWAVQMACQRFAKGRVTKAECPDWKRAYAPTTAQLCPAAEASAREYWREEVRINAVLDGVPAYQPNQEERERVTRNFERLQQKLRPNKAAAATAAAEARLKQPQPIAIAVSGALKQAMGERDELEQWLSGQSEECAPGAMTGDKRTSG